MYFDSFLKLEPYTKPQGDTITERYRKGEGVCDVPFGSFDWWVIHLLKPIKYWVFSASTIVERDCIWSSV